MLRIEELTKYFGGFQALDRLSMTVETGTIMGFVGPNGAGKTTTMRIIAALMRPTSGSVWVDDVEVGKEPRRSRLLVGYMPDFFGVYDNLLVEDYLEFFADAYYLPKAGREELYAQLLSLVALSDKRHAQVDTLSRGMKQRLCLARCLVHNPNLLVLDEPASGMDPAARAEMKGILRELRDMGKTILISSHILPELAELCDQITFIDHGKVRLTGDIEEVLAMTRGNGRIGIRMLTPEGVAQAVDILREQPGILSLAEEGLELNARFDGTEEQACEMLRHLVTAGVPVVGFGRQTGNLENAFLEVIGGDPQ